MPAAQDAGLNVGGQVVGPDQNDRHIRFELAARAHELPVAEPPCEVEGRVPREADGEGVVLEGVVLLKDRLPAIVPTEGILVAIEDKVNLGPSGFRTSMG